MRGSLVGGWRGRPDSPVPFQWTSNKIKVLGTFIGNGNLDEANWCPCVDAVAKGVSAWSSRHLSYGGRALISNALALARVWYMATLLPIPGWTLGKLNRIIFPGCPYCGHPVSKLKRLRHSCRSPEVTGPAAFTFSLLDTVRFSCLSRRGPRVPFFF